MPGSAMRGDLRGGTLGQRSSLLEKRNEPVPRGI
jgi:hypothetical protein